jgi:hypothetical protein
LGQRIPISVEIVGERDDGTTIYRLIDGEHRLKALAVLAKQHKDRPDFEFVNAEIKEFSSDAERTFYKVKCNGHDTLPAKANTEADATIIMSQLTAGTLEGLPEQLKGHTPEELYKRAPEAYYDVLVKSIKDTYEWTTKKAESAVKKFLNKLPGKLENYTSDTLTQKFNSFADGHWSVAERKGKKITFRGRDVFKLGTTQHVFPNITGNTFRCKTADTTKEAVVVVWDNDTIGKDFTQVDTNRREMIQKMNEANSSEMLRQGKKLVDRIFLAPQKLNIDDSEDFIERGFYEVEKDSNGNFITGFPTTGWDIAAPASEC